MQNTNLTIKGTENINYFVNGLVDSPDVPFLLKIDIYDFQRRFKIH